MSSLVATVNPGIKQMRREVDRYRRFVRAHLLAYGGSWDSITPARKSPNPFARFLFFSRRFDALMKMPASSERDDALRVIHNSLWRVATNIDSK